MKKPPTHKTSQGLEQRTPFLMKMGPSLLTCDVTAPVMDQPKEQVPQFHCIPTTEFWNFSQPCTQSSSSPQQVLKISTAWLRVANHSPTIIMHSMELMNKPTTSCNVMCYFSLHGSLTFVRSSTVFFEVY